MNMDDQKGDTDVDEGPEKNDKLEIEDTTLSLSMISTDTSFVTVQSWISTYLLLTYMYPL